MLALHERGYVFEAVAGTSAGSLNAAIWAMQDLTGGETLWSQMRPQTTYDRSWWLRLLPRPVSRMLGAVTVAFSILFARMAGSPIDGINEERVDSILFSLVFFPIFFVVLFVTWNTTPWYTSSFYAIIFGLMGGYWIEMFKFNAGAAEGDISFGAIMMIMLSSIASGAKSVSLAGPFLPDEAIARWPLSIVIFLASSVAAALTISLISSAAFSLLSGVRVLTNSPLRATLTNYLRLHSFKMPTYVTVASKRQIFDPDDPLWVSQAPVASTSVEAFRIADREGPWNARTTAKWVPYYVRIDSFGADQAADYLLASSALPFGVVAPVKIGESIYVDGGVIDNLPILPLISHQLDEIVVLDLTPRMVEQTQEEHRNRCAMLQRLQMLATRPLPPQAHKVHPGRGKLIPPTRFPPPAIANMPRIVVLRPSQSLGGIFGGTLNFSPKYAARMIALGRAETLARLDTGSAASSR